MFKKIIIALAPLIAFGILYLLTITDKDDIIPKKKNKNTEFCYGDTCKNTCNKINATKAKPGGELEGKLEAIEENENNKFKAENCDIGTKLLANTLSNKSCLPTNKSLRSPSFIMSALNTSIPSSCAKAN